MKQGIVRTGKNNGNLATVGTELAREKWDIMGVLYSVRVWDFTITILGKGTWDRGLVDLGCRGT